MAKNPNKQGELAYQLLSHQNTMTWDRYGDLALNNIAQNNTKLDQGSPLSALRDQNIGDGDSAIVIAAGPSLKRKNPGLEIKESGYKGALVVTESAIPYCLRNGIVPDLAITVDPHPTRVVRWLGDPTLSQEALESDDYFSRQDQDDAFNNEMKANEEILELMDKYGGNIRMALATTSAENVVERTFEIGMDVYWWNPMLDDPDEPNSMTVQIQDENGLPAVNAGGNVGTACWMMAGAVLDKSDVALTGVDFSYYDETPHRNTQYYHEAVKLVGEENLDSIFARFHNPHLDKWFYTDPAYLWYRESLLELLQETDWRTYNCTEGGIVFGDGVEFIPLAEFLSGFS